MAKKARVYTGTEWVDLATATTDLSQYSNLITNQPTFRNVLINGGFSIDQRNGGASQTITAAAALAYTVDRWYAFCTGANITGARVAGTAPSQHFYQFTGATSNTAVGFGQRIEAANCFHLANQNVTLGINIASTSLTSITWTAFYANTTDTFGTLASPTRTQIATGTFTVNSTLSRKTATFTVPSAATTGIEIVFTGAALLGSQTLTYDDAQLEVGNVASAFEQRPIGVELVLCQRYYEKSYDINVTPGTSTNDGMITQSGTAAGRTTGEIRSDVSFKVTKRVNPTTITIYDSVGNINRVTRGDYGTAFNANQTVSIAYSGQSNFCLFSGGSGVFGSAHVLHYTASAEL
jgi:hypothetical protein